MAKPILREKLTRGEFFVAPASGLIGFEDVWAFEKKWARD